MGKFQALPVPINHGSHTASCCWQCVRWQWQRPPHTQQPISASMQHGELGQHCIRTHHDSRAQDRLTEHLHTRSNQRCSSKSAVARPSCEPRSGQWQLPLSLHKHDRPNKFRSRRYPADHCVQRSQGGGCCRCGHQEHCPQEVDWLCGFCEPAQPVAPQECAQGLQLQCHGRWYVDDAATT